MLSPWQRKQSSYCAVTELRTAPPELTPFTPANAPEAFGAVAEVGFEAWGLWQSMHSTWRCGFMGSSMGSWMPVVLRMGCALNLLNSPCRFLAATFPLW